MVEQNRMPPSAHDFALRDMQFSNGDQYTLVRNAPGTTTSEYVLFPGCQLGGSAPEHVEKVYGYLRQQLKDHTVGLMLGCCGAPAYWAGQTGQFEATLAAWREHLRALGNPTLVLPCSSCYQVFKSSLPGVELISLWEIFAQQGLPAEAVPAPEGRTVAVHDPCTARYARDVQDSVRDIMQRLGYHIDELPLSRERTTCCGYGGLMWLANRDLAKRVVKRRVEESRADYVTYCAMCRDFFAGQGKRALHLLDLIYDRGDDTRAERRSPGFS
jgi:glutamate synthase (NADPH/NADH) small chain